MVQCCEYRVFIPSVETLGCRLDNCFNYDNTIISVCMCIFSTQLKIEQLYLNSIKENFVSVSCTFTGPEIEILEPKLKGVVSNFASFTLPLDPPPPPPPFYLHGLTKISVWLSKHMSSKVWGEIVYLFPNFNGMLFKHLYSWFCFKQSCALDCSLCC